MSCGQDRSYPWSYSRARLLDRCERLYYEHYHGSRGGGAASAPARTQLAFRLKSLTTPRAELGRAIHRRAAEIARAIRDGAPLPTHADMLSATRMELEPIIMRRSTDSAWLSDPARAPLLQEAYYGGMSRARRSQLLAELCERASRLLSALLDAPVWRAAGMAGAKILLIDEPLTATMDGLSVIATPDLVLRLPDDRLIVVDWKTGETADMAQVVLYAHAVQASLGLPIGGNGCDAWLMHLDRSALEAVTVVASEVDAVRAAVRESVGRMRTLDTVVETNALGAREHFRMAADPNTRCRRCRMFSLCSHEFTKSAVASWRSPSWAPPSPRGPATPRPCYQHYVPPPKRDDSNTGQPYFSGTESSKSRQTSQSCRRISSPVIGSGCGGSNTQRA